MVNKRMYIKDGLVYPDTPREEKKVVSVSVLDGKKADNRIQRRIEAYIRCGSVAGLSCIQSIEG